MNSQLNLLPFRTTWLLTLWLVLAPQLAVQLVAQGSQEKLTPYAIPELPALTFVGGSANNVTRPVTPRALATELANGVDSAGRVKQGLAVAVAPYALLGGSVDVKEYQTNWRKYVLYNAQVSGGSVRTGGDANATDLGFGFRLTLIDHSDPMLDSAYTRQVRKLLEAGLPDDPDDADLAFAAAKEKVIAYRKQWRKDNWNRAGLALAAASGWRLNESSILPATDSRWLGWSVWATGALPLGANRGSW
ncbi:hypothetical protein [Hymenobacter sp. HDW8]|uniref:hypothetical protein n=1 Tax=Hymenobacter sp. HDW8 TaxID=2714932 RepID=UPI00140B1A85|nr:hypothetical protein [Hymenobacter sp. HDW8]QIL76330.1 hypothetical protein G7064_11000 [Hymenobacter sp. HDW8]